MNIMIADKANFCRFYESISSREIPLSITPIKRHWQVLDFISLAGDAKEKAKGTGGRKNGEMQMRRTGGEIFTWSTRKC